VLTLGGADGYFLVFHGPMAGRALPTAVDERAHRIAGGHPFTVGERLDQMIAAAPASHVVVTALHHSDDADALLAALRSRGTVLVERPDLVVVRLRPLQGSGR
jgi:hypothetical protein